MQALLSFDNPASAKANAAPQNASAGNTVSANAPSVEQDTAADDDTAHPGETPEETIQRLMAELTAERRKSKSFSKEAQARKLEIKEKVGKAQETMTAQERQISDLQQEMAELRKERALDNMKVRFAGLGFAEDAASDAATAFQEEDLDTVFAQLKSWYAEGVRKAKNEALMQTPYPRNGQGNPRMTKAEYDKLPTRKQWEIRQTDPDLYNSFYPPKS